MLYLAEASVLFVHWKQHCLWKAARTLQHGPLCHQLVANPPCDSLLCLRCHPLLISASFSPSLFCPSVVVSTAWTSPTPQRGAGNTTFPCRAREEGVRFVVTLMLTKSKMHFSPFLKHLEFTIQQKLYKVVFSLLVINRVRYLSHVSISGRTSIQRQSKQFFLLLSWKCFLVSPIFFLSFSDSSPWQQSDCDGRVGVIIWSAWCKSSTL